MRSFITLIMLLIGSTAVIAQNSIVASKNFEKIRRGYSPYELASNDKYHFTLEDVSPDKVSIASPAFLITYNKENDSFSKNKIKFENSKKAIHGSFATDKHLFILYEGKNKKEKNFGIFLGQYDLIGEHVKTIPVFDVDSRSELREVEVYQSPDRSYTGISFNKRFILIDKDLNKVYSKDLGLSEVVSALIDNSGKSWLTGIEEDKGIQLYAISIEGKVESTTDLELPKGAYHLFMKKDPVKNNLYISIIIGENKDKFFSSGKKDKGNEMIVQVLNSNNLRDKKTITHEFKEQISYLVTANIYGIGEDIYVVANPRYITSGRYAEYDMAEDIHLFRIRGEEIAAYKKYDRKIQIQRFSFPWLTMPVVKEIGGKPYLFYYDTRNALSFKFNLESGVLKEDLTLSQKKQYDTSKLKFIPNHTQMRDSKELLVTGFHTTGLNWKIGTAVVKF